MKFDLDAIERQCTLTAALATKLQKHKRHLEQQRDAYAVKVEQVNRILGFRCPACGCAVGQRASVSGVCPNCLSVVTVTVG